MFGWLRSILKSMWSKQSSSSKKKTNPKFPARAAADNCTSLSQPSCEVRVQAAKCDGAALSPISRQMVATCSKLIHEFTNQTTQYANGVFPDE